MEVSDACKSKGLEGGNAKLKRLLAEQMLDVAVPKEMLTKKLLTPGVRRAAVTLGIEQKNYSQRRACRSIGLEPKTCRYAFKRLGDGEVRVRLRVLAGETAVRSSATAYSPGA